MIHLTNKFRFIQSALRWTIFAGFGTLTLLDASIAMGAQVEAKRDNVEVYTSADKSSGVMATLKKGEQIDADDRSGMYWKVKTNDGKSGFVSIMQVSNKPASKGGLDDALRSAVKQGRQQSESNGSSRARSSVMGVRGLDESNTSAASNLRPDLRRVYMMEDFSVGEEKIEQQANLVENDILMRSAKKN